MTFSTAATGGLWAAFVLVVATMLVLDLGFFQRAQREPTFRESLAWSAVWLALALAFGASVGAHLGSGKGFAFLTAYVVEKALSVDNLLVLLLVLTQFRVPPAARRRALLAGVVGAFALRTVLILGGTSLVSRFHALTYLLGAALLLAAVKLLRGERPEERAPESLTERMARRLLPVSTGFDGTRFFVVEAGVLRATPLFITVLVIEVTDLVFALDSIPAVLAVTSDPFVALTSNLFAVLGLRSLFFVVSGLLARLRHLKTGLALVLAFVAGKMLLSFAVHVPEALSLLVVILILLGAAAASLRGRHPLKERT